MKSRLMTRLNMVCILLMLLLVTSGCDSQRTSVYAELPLSSWTSNYAYQFSYQGNNGVLISYRLHQFTPLQETTPTTWCYPVTTVATSENCAEEALNATLENVCAFMGIPVLRVNSVSLDANGVATLDLPAALRDSITPNTPRRVLDALVLTLTEFSDVAKVQFLFDGHVHNFMIVDGGVQIDTSMAISRPAYYNDDTYTNSQGRKAVIYWQLQESDYLVPVTQVLSPSAVTPQELFLLMVRTPEELGTGFSSSVMYVGEQVQSPLQPIWDEESAMRVKFRMSEGILQVSFPADIITANYSHPQLLNSLIAQVRTFLELPEVSAVQILLDDRAIPFTIHRLSLADPIRALPYINIVSSLAFEVDETP